MPPKVFSSITSLIDAPAVTNVPGDISCAGVKPGVSIIKSSGNPEPKTLSPGFIVPGSPAILANLIISVVVVLAD